MISKFLVRALVVCSLLAFGCGSCDEGGSGTTDTGVTPTDASDVDAPDGEAVSCEPNEIIRCTEENTPGLERCNGAGTEIVQGSCGNSEVCREAECVAVDCIPGTRRCAATGAQPQECNEEGTGWTDLEACGESISCEEGFCLSRCDVAERTNSYIGCEYWAVELENHLLNSDEDDDPLPEDRRPPYAIVLANTEDYDASVSVYTDDGEFAQAVDSRVVASDVSLPGIDYVTVHSELLDGEGNRIQGPFSGDIDNLPLPSGAIMTLVMPSRSVDFGKSSLEKLAYRVESTQPVVAYQFNPLCCNYNFTNDASLLLPTSALTENYMFMSYAVWNGGDRRLDEPYSSNMTVMATEPDTRVSVRLRQPKGTDDSGATRPYSDLIYPFDDASGGVEGPDDSGLLEVTMQPFEVLNLAGAGVDPVEDMTGAIIEASNPIAVFGSHTCAFVPFSTPACDHLESQLFPLETWGRRFHAAPLKLRQDDASGTREGTYYKFLAREDGTRIEVGLDINRPNVLSPADEGVTPCQDFAVDAEAGIFELDSGESCEFGTRDLFVVETTQPIMLGAFLSGQNSVTSNADWGSHAGDPAFFLVPPDEQYRREYSFLTPATYHQSYVTITAQSGVAVTLDGEEIQLSDYDYEENFDRGVVRAHIPVDPGPHQIESHVPFGLIVYGYDDYVSYAYTGGLDFKKLTPWD